MTGDIESEEKTSNTEGQRQEHVDRGITIDISVYYDCMIQRIISTARQTHRIGLAASYKSTP